MKGLDYPWRGSCYTMAAETPPLRGWLEDRAPSRETHRTGRGVRPYTLSGFVDPGDQGLLVQPKGRRSSTRGRNPACATRSSPPALGKRPNALLCLRAARLTQADAFLKSG